MKTQLQIYGMQQKQFQREVYSNTILLQEPRKTSNRQSNFTPKNNWKKKEKNLQNQQKERNQKNLSRNKWGKNEKKIVKINKTKSWFFEKTHKIDKIGRAHV